ncbi:hypothetical protein BDP55DRAFT_751381 [Colletotrichum godetiae]|uniref:Uncharacterized protein n=1 Tax=Colletotrichum godetiae TaxID=1209918 RepID=A0AAJ0B0P5_9PEZI|nr:uncharacterized protein BDP55DRAFT_751381 [Colletotrichum godetiae]KAK1691594.1 hypothetical protein BDP55DRAFT_751381 [Colletotrichum godetiae]
MYPRLNGLHRPGLGATGWQVQISTPAISASRTAPAGPGSPRAGLFPQRLPCRTAPPMDPGSRKWMFFLPRSKVSSLNPESGSLQMEGNGRLGSFLSLFRCQVVLFFRSSSLDPGMQHIPPTTVVFFLPPSQYQSIHHRSWRPKLGVDQNEAVDTWKSGTPLHKVRTLQSPSSPSPLGTPPSLILLHKTRDPTALRLYSYPRSWLGAKCRQVCLIAPTTNTHRQRIQSPFVHETTGTASIDRCQLDSRLTFCHHPLRNRKKCSTASAQEPLSSAKALCKPRSSLGHPVPPFPLGLPVPPLDIIPDGSRPYKHTRRLLEAPHPPPTSAHFSSLSGVDELATAVLNTPSQAVKH